MQGQQDIKRMNLVQLTFIVAVNMMGSGIIMLPTNMAQVGAISLLSWIVTALGSMAIAYGFAQAGLFNQRPGGMSAYAEDAYGKSGYFLVFFLYFLSLAIGNVAIAISAVGCLASFFPGLSSTPIATCMSVIALLWLTTVANFGGPCWTGRIGSVSVMGVAVLACLGSLVCWQFTIAQNSKSSADERMFPGYFSRVNRLGAPITGMPVLGIVQSLLALSTIWPSRSQQFSALVNLAVVT